MPVPGTNNTGQPAIGQMVTLLRTVKSVLGHDIPPASVGKIVSYTNPWNPQGSLAMPTTFAVQFTFLDLIAPPRFESAFLVRSDFWL